MKNYMYKLLEQIYEDKGKKINYLIDTEVLTKNFIIKKAIESKNAYTLYNVALYINNLTKEDIDKIAEVIIKIGDLDTLYLYAENIPNAPIDKITNIIIENGNAKYIFRLALCTKEKPYYIKKLMNEIINLKEAEYIYLFTEALFSNLEYKDIDKLENAIIKTKDLEYIYEFAKNIKRASIRKLALTIIKTENEEYIQKLKELENAPEDIDLMIERIKLEKQSEYIQITHLNALIKLQETTEIKYNADIYRKLFVDTDEEINEIEEEIKHKKRVLTPKQREEQNIPQFPGINRKKVGDSYE